MLMMGSDAKFYWAKTYGDFSTFNQIKASGVLFDSKGEYFYESLSYSLISASTVARPLMKATLLTSTS